ncbi:MAG: hypothetical protein AAGH76_01140 [Pseudomonadota bacterium]
MSSEQQDFYVGYLPTPATLARWYRVFVPVLILAAASFGYWLAGSQQAAGTGTWAYGQSRTVSGRLVATPYPHVVTPTGESVLLVREGKLGVDDWAQPNDGRIVAVTGYAIERGAWHMLEIATESAIDVQSDAAIDVVVPTIQLFGEHTLSGEIVDSKCFLGVMKPGDGLVHRACAELCIRGGLPPMLVAASPDGERAGYLLIAPDGSSAKALVAGSVGIPVTITGTVSEVGALRYLTMADTTIEALALATNDTGDWCALPVAGG